MWGGSEGNESGRSEWVFEGGMGFEGNGGVNSVWNEWVNVFHFC